MFEHGFPPYWSTIKKLIWLVGTGIVGGVTEIWKTVTGTIIHITDALEAPMRKCEVTLEPIQAGSGDPSPTNVRPITGWTGCDATRAGKNVFDGVFQQGTFTNEGTELATNTRIRSNFIPVSEGTIAISTPTANALIHEAYAYNSSKTFVRKIGFLPAAESQVSTIQSGESFIRFSVRYTDNSVITPNDNVRAQVEFNQTATDYEPYSGTTISVTFPDGQTVYGGTVDLVSGEMTVKYFIKTFTGEESWTKYSSDSVLSNFTFTSNATQVIMGRCSHVKTESNGSINYQIISHSYTFNGVQVNRITTYWGLSDNEVATWKAYLQDQFSNGTPLQICAELRTPITYQLTPQEISTLKGENNIWGDGTITAIYKATE